MDRRESYLGELAVNWRVLLAASLGMAVGIQLFSYITSIFAPFLIKQFGWERSLFALIGFTMLATLPTMPIAGRLTDRFGVRAMTLVGVLLFPAVIFLFSLLDGSFAYYFACSAGILVVGCLVSPVTYTRLVVEQFQKARGLALTIVMSAPAVMGVLAPPFITRYVTSNGWQSGYRALAVFVLVSGLAAVALIPRGSGNAPVKTAVTPGQPKERHFREVLGSSLFWVIFLAVLLTTIHTPLHGSQFVVMLNEQGLDAMGAARLLQVYAGGTLVGRIACGLALDRYPTRIVAALSMVLPAFGLALLASPFDTAWLLGLAVFLVGVTVGAEGDLLSFIVSRYFRIEVFSTALGLCYSALYLASISGVLLLSTLLKRFDTFGPFLLFTAGAVLIGAMMFLRLPAGGGQAKQE